MDYRNTALMVGVGTVVVTHGAMMLTPDMWQQTQKDYHAILNLAAAGAIVWGARLVPGF